MSGDTEKVMPKIGFWWDGKKSRELNTTEFIEACRKVGYELVRLDWSRPLEEQGPFVAIVHKMCNLLIQADRGDENSKQILQRFENYCAMHPEMVVVDPPHCVRKILNRYRTYKLVRDSALGKIDWMYTPPFVELPTNDVDDNIRRLREANVTFPIVCKYIVSHGVGKPHEMALVFNERGLDKIEAPCVAQKFVHHGATLFKLFCMGDKFFVITRPSLRNFVADPDRETECFNSHDVSKAHSSSPLIDVIKSLQNATPPPKDKLDVIVRVVGETFGHTLFGVDVIEEEETGKLSVIDVNNFPGYDGVKDFLDKLAAMLDTLVREKSASLADSKLNAGKPGAVKHSNNSGSTATLDSGIDDSASCSDSSVKS